MICKSFHSFILEEFYQESTQNFVISYTLLSNFLQNHKKVRGAKSEKAEIEGWCNLGQR
jgi:hypothetical protein